MNPSKKTTKKNPERIPRLDLPEIGQLPHFLKVVDDLLSGNNVFLVGSAGTGKTTLAEKVAYSLAGRQDGDGQAPPFVVINCNQWTSPIDLKGGQTIEGYQEGGMIEAWRDGKLLILDELPKLDANTAGILNDALAKSAKADAVIFNGKNEAIPKHPHFGCIATGNTTGKATSAHYVGNNKQDASLLDRFSGCVYRIGFNETLERQLIYPALVEKCIEIRKYILTYEGKEAADDDTDDILTLRTMLNFQRGYELEMLRATGRMGSADSPSSARLNREGKTLKDAFESFFLVMGGEKATAIREQADMDAFYNSYKGGEMKTSFLKAYDQRHPE